jgi:hypothetical protein
MDGISEKHPGFYRYTNKEKFDFLIETTKQSIRDSLTELQYYRLLKPLFAQIGCLHTGISLSKEYQDYLKKQAKKRNVSVEALRPDERELEIITKLAFAEHRMKYVLANANKGDTDRLAQRDIDDAAKSTQIMTFFRSPSIVQNNYKQIESTFNKKLNENISLLKSSGVTDDWILKNAGNVPGVQKIYEEAASRNKQRQTRQNVADQPQAQTNILKTIPIR